MFNSSTLNNTKESLRHIDDTTETNKRSFEETQTPKKVLVDIAHGYEVFIPAKVSPMGATLKKYGYEVTPLTKGNRFNSSILSDVDVVMIAMPDPNLGYTTAELEALNDYWNNGGSLLIIGTPIGGELSPALSELNRILDAITTLNASFGNALAVAYDNTLPEHFITTGVESLYMRGTRIEYDDNGLFTLISKDSQNDPNLVTYDNPENSQRGLIFGDILPFLEYTYYSNDLNWNNYTNKYQFILNVFQWLTYDDFIPIGDPEPIFMQTYGDNSFTKNQLRRMDLYKGICHFHTTYSDGSATVEEAVDFFKELDYDYVVISDHDTGEGIMPMRNYRDTAFPSLSVIGGEEVSPTTNHVLAWGFNDTIPAPLDIQTRIDLIHSVGSPAMLCHPSWLVSADHPRIWDNDLYPFDGYEIINSGYIQGCGNLADFPWYIAADTHGNSAASFSTDINYVLTSDEVTDNADWWTSSVFERRLVGYNARNDLYCGDEVVLNEVYGRLMDEDAPEITYELGGLQADKTFDIELIIQDDSPLETVELTIDGNVKSLTKSNSNYSIYTGNIGTYEPETEITVEITATDDKGYSSTETFTQVLELAEGVELSSSTTSTDSSSSTTPEGPSTPFALLPSIIGILVLIRKKKQVK